MNVERIMENIFQVMLGFCEYLIARINRET